MNFETPRCETGPSSRRSSIAFSFSVSDTRGWATQQQVDVPGVESVETPVACLPNVTGPEIRPPHLPRQEQLLPVDVCHVDTLSDLLFAVVRLCRVDVAIASPECRLDTAGTPLSRVLPGAEANLGCLCLPDLNPSGRFIPDGYTEWGTLAFYPWDCLPDRTPPDAVESGQISWRLNR